MDKQGLKVSVITVCLNSAARMEEAITSLIKQSYGNIEYIIVDGGSTDRSSGLFDKYRGRIDKLIIEKDNGIFDAMNKGVRAASGDIIYFLNSDDRFYDDYALEKAAEVFVKNSQIDFLYGNLIASDSVNNKFREEKYPARISRWLMLRKTVGHPASFFRRACFEKAGYFNQEYAIAADYEWFLRAVFISKLKSLHINYNISVFRLGGNSSAGRDLDAYFNERILIQKKYFNILEICYTWFVFVVKKISARMNLIKNA